ncbi:MAG: hypothetical protein AB1543_01335 [Candidatus Bipolaricaulota bacterium]
MIGWAYRLLVGLLVILVTWDLLREKSVRRQAVAAMVLVPLVLRLLMIK